MTQITDYAYGKIKDYIINNFNYLELQDGSGTPVKRFNTTDGLSITINESTQEIEYKVVVSGANYLDATVAKSVIYDVATGGEPIATETFTPFTFESIDDELTVIHKLQVPKIV